ncbi:MAG: dihydrolipoamide acyltransferase [Ktedonobacterales bacterium]|jgi:predicted thioesterase|nr:MAG: dihydrolipoamide acyltransferase [Ktedonobacterales bacterium]
MGLEVGMRGEVSLVVGEEQTAMAFGAGGVRVFGTPVMIGLMENAAWRMVQPELAEGETTVGTLVNVRHLAATPVGDTVIATAELVEVDGRRLVFHVTARDSRQLIGEGTHERARVLLDRFLARLYGDK